MFSTIHDERMAPFRNDSVGLLPATRNESAILPMARMVRDEWMTTYYRGALDKDNFTNENNQKRDEYLSLMLKEPAVSTAYWSLIASVMSLPLKAHAEDPDNPTEVYWANFVSDAIAACKGGVPRVVRDLAAGGLLFGFGVNELVFDYPERGKWRQKLVLADLGPLDSRYIRFDLDPYKRVVGVRGMKANSGQVFGPDRFAIFSHQSLFGSVFGISAFRTAYRAAKLMESAIKLRVILLQNYTGPFLIYKSQNITSRETAMRTLDEARALGYMVCDKPDEVEVANLAAGADSEFQAAMDDFRKEMYTAIRWGYLPFTEASTGVQVGNSEVQRSMTQLGEWKLATEIASVMTEQIAKPLMRANCADESIGFPRLTLGGQNTTDKKAAGDIFEQGRRIGVKLSKKQVQRALDLEEPNGAEDEIIDQQSAMGGMGGNPFGGLLGAGGNAGPTAGDGGTDAAPPGGDGSPVPNAGGPAAPAAGGQQAPNVPTGGIDPDGDGSVDLAKVDPRLGTTTPTDMDKAAMIAILDLQAKAAQSGHPGQFQKAIGSLRAAIGNHAAIVAMLSGPPDQQFSWSPAPTATGGVKAVGHEEHEGHTLYGKRAQIALQHHEKTPEVQKQSWDTHSTKVNAKQKAKDLSTKVMSHQATADDYKELAGQLEHLTIPELRAVRTKIAGTFGGGTNREAMVQRLTQHVLKESADIPIGWEEEHNRREASKATPKAGGDAKPAAEPSFADKFKSAHAATDHLAMHDLIGEALQGKHGDGVNEAVGKSLDAHYANRGAGGLDAKHAAILKAVGDHDEKSKIKGESATKSPEKDADSITEASKDQSRGKEPEKKPEKREGIPKAEYPTDAGIPDRKEPVGAKKAYDSSTKQIARVPENHKEALALATAARQEIIGSGKTDCAIEGDCERASFALFKLHPEAEIWHGHFDDADKGPFAHNIAKIGDYFIDVTGDQFDGGKPVAVFTADDMVSGKNGADRYHMGGFQRAKSLEDHVNDPERPQGASAIASVIGDFAHGSNLMKPQSKAHLQRMAERKQSEEAELEARKENARKQKKEDERKASEEEKSASEKAAKTAAIPAWERTGNDLWQAVKDAGTLIPFAESEGVQWGKEEPTKKWQSWLKAKAAKDGPAGDAETPKPVGSTKLPDGREVKFIPHELQRDTETTVLVDPKKLDAQFQTDDPGFAVKPDGTNEVKGKVAGIAEFLKKGEPLQASRMEIGDDGKLSATDGRHRLRHMSDAGAEEHAVTVPKDQSEEFTKRFGKDAAPSDSPETPDDSKAVEEHPALTGREYQKLRKADGPYKIWIHADPDEDPDKGFFRTFKDHDAYSEWVDSGGHAVLHSDRVVGGERVFYRNGNLPTRWISKNHVENKSEGGVSVYPEPKATSFAGMVKGDWYKGKGVQVGTGSDGEPVIIPTGKWDKHDRDAVGAKSAESKAKEPAGTDADPIPLKVAPAAPPKTEELNAAIHDAYDQLRREKFRGMNSLVPIADLKAAVREKHPGATDEQFAEAAMAMRRDKGAKLKPLEADSPEKLTPEQRAAGVSTGADTFHYLDSRDGNHRPPDAPVDPDRLQKLKDTIKSSLGTVANSRGMLPIHELRDHVEKTVGDVGKDEFDQAMMGLRREKAFRAVSIDDRSRATPEQLSNSVHGVGETLFSVDMQSVPGRAAPAGVKAEPPVTQVKADEKPKEPDPAKDPTQSLTDQAKAKNPPTPEVKAGAEKIPEPENNSPSGVDRTPEGVKIPSVGTQSEKPGEGGKMNHLKRISELKSELKKADSQPAMNKIVAELRSIEKPYMAAAVAAGIPAYATPEKLVERYPDYADAIRNGRVKLSTNRASIDVDGTESLVGYGVPDYRPGGNADPIARKIAAQVVRELVDKSGVDIPLSGNFDWGILPSQADDFTAPELVEYLKAQHGNLPRQRAERASQILTDGQNSSDKI